MDDPPLPVESDTFYRTLVENAAEGMLTIDANSLIVYANPAIEDILGYAPEELVGSSKMKIIPERLQEVHAEALDAYVRTGERNIDWDGVELPALHEDGHEVPTLISLREHTHDGQQYFTGILRDVTDRRRRETELHEQKARLDEFADILAHDIRNPLSVADGYAKLASEQHDVPELEHVRDALEQIDTLVEDVLELSKQGKLIGDTEPLDLEACVRESWRNAETASATIHIEDDLGVVSADKSRLRELLGNLFRNAVEHAGTDVTVRVGRLPATDDHPGGFFVADDGPGVPESTREDVFEHGFSTRDGGTGYGLAIVRQITNAHDWTVTQTESAAGGARFDFGNVAFRAAEPDADSRR